MVWSSGFYGGTINYLDAAHCEESCAAGSAVFDQRLFTVDDYTTSAWLRWRLRIQHTVGYSILLQAGTK